MISLAEIMTEQLLQFIWQFRYYNQQSLQLLSGEAVQVDSAGTLNKNQGPDFLDAQVRIANDTWVGSVELHLVTSGWVRHAHEEDPLYRNVILHVVWQHDRTFQQRNIPILELQPLVAGRLLDRYATWMNNRDFIPCCNSQHTVPEKVWNDWKENLCVQRMKRKAASINLLLLQNNYHWEETIWWKLAGNLGMKVNGAAFEAMAKSIPLSLIGRLRENPVRLEAMLFGQAGLLDAVFKEAYPLLLQQEYRFLKKKFQLPTLFEPVLFLRMRPENFPTLRLSQLAVILYREKHLFAFVKEVESVESVIELLLVCATDYWNDHYMLDKPVRYQPKALGRLMAENIVINSIVPVLYQFATLDKNNGILDKCARWLQTLPAEANNIVNGWKALGVNSSNAADSQALLELKIRYCDEKKCLSCDIGKTLLR